MAHQAPTLSAAISFYTLTSLAPVLVVAVAVAGALLGESAVRADVVEQIGAVLGEDAAALVGSLFESVSLPGPGITVGVAAAGAFLLASTAAFVQLQDALNVVWSVPRKSGPVVRKLLRKRAVSFLLVLGVGVVLLVSSLLRAVLVALADRVELPGFLAGSGDVLASFAGLTLLFTLMFRLLPDAATPWRHLLIGSAVTAGLFLAGQAGIGLYLGRASLASAYGAAGSVVVLLLGVYYACMALLWGAELTFALGRGEGDAEGGDAAG